ncbi:acetyl-CoA carboxylase biotin carboxyl carrier protein [Hathewaya massiliensis]|uniref:acetyl-CoA carboxylase biotin carboxyl carrier protein n=1 Tax=Hathewaya massiliensis TaxID=1964382 RepID=UPI00115A7AE3|nr:acetyl-CoA carboxylase biotin carboxyl carrier protein [Hathewaya massiliensis]
MDYKEIENLIKVLSDSKLTYLEIEKEGLFIKMGKESKTIIAKNLPVEREEFIKEDLIEKQEILNNEEKSQVLEKEQIKEKIDEEDFHIITSPIVGTFYSSGTPGGERFVKIGDRVKKGDTLCIIEAMKLMNEINSDVDGIIEEILVSNEDMVQYGESLFKIRK